MHTLDIIKKLELNNRNTIKCINVQVMSQIRYFIGLLIFTVGCLNKIDVQVRKTLKELDYRNEKQSIQRLYLDERYMGSKLMSARDIHLRTLVSIYKTIQQRDKNDYLMKTESEINTKWETKHHTNK